MTPTLGAILQDPYVGDRIQLDAIVIVILWRSPNSLEFYSRERGGNGMISLISLDQWRARWTAWKATFPEMGSPAH